MDDLRVPKLNPLHPTPEQVADDERRAAIYRELITAWVEKTGYKVLIAPEVEKEMAHNKRLLCDPLPANIRKNVVNCETFWNADEAASVFARAHTAVCHEPHSLIIALANGTPIIHTYSEFHSPKCWMFQDIGLSEWLLEFDSTPAETLKATLFEIDADYPAALAKVEKAMDFVHQRQADTMRVVKNVLGCELTRLPPGGACRFSRRRSRGGNGLRSPGARRRAGREWSSHRRWRPGAPARGHRPGRDAA